MASAWKPFWVFVALSVLLLALVPILSAFTGASMNFAEVARRASTITGIAWTSNLWNVVRLALAEPDLWLLVLGSSVPTLAALMVLAWLNDRSQWSALLKRLSPFRTEHISAAIALYALLVLCVIGCLLGAYAVRQVIAPDAYSTSASTLGLSLLFAIATAAFLDQGAVLEEAGWRGFATPWLQDHLMTPLAAAILVGIVWSLWHVPRDVVSGVVERLGLVRYLSMYLPSFVAGGIGVSVVAVYFMNRLGGSLIPAIMVHGLANDSMGISGAATINQALTPLHQFTKAVPFLILAALIVYVAGRQLGHDETARNPAPS